MSDDVKKLYRSKDDRMIAGVCGGLAAYFKIDATLIRIVFVVIGLLGGGVLLYLLLWLVIPEEESAEADSEEPEESEEAEKAEIQGE